MTLKQKLQITAGVLGFLAVFGLVGTMDYEDAVVAEAHAKSLQQKQKKKTPAKKQDATACLLFSKDFKKECAK